MRTLGQIVQNAGCVMSPYWDFPQLLALLLRILHEGNAAARREVRGQEGNGSGGCLAQEARCMFMSTLILLLQCIQTDNYGVAVFDCRAFLLQWQYS